MEEPQSAVVPRQLLYGPEDIIDIARYRQATNRIGLTVVNLSAPDNPSPLIVQVALDDLETLILQDRLPNQLRKSAVDAADEYEEEAEKAEEIVPETGKKRGFDPDALKASLEYLDHSIHAIMVRPRYVLMADAGVGAVPDGALCLKDFGDYERAAVMRLMFGGLDALARFHQERQMPPDSEDVQRDDADAPERSGDSARAESVDQVLAGRSSVHSDETARPATDGEGSSGAGQGTGANPFATANAGTRQDDGPRAGASADPEFGISEITRPA